MFPTGVIDISQQHRVFQFSLIPICKCSWHQPCSDVTCYSCVERGGWEQAEAVTHTVVTVMYSSQFKYRGWF